MKYSFLKIAALNALLMLAPAVLAQTIEPALTREKPLWSKGVQSLGYKSWSMYAELSWVGEQHAKILFPDEDHVALAWLRPDPTGESSAGAIPLPETPSLLHLILLDSKTGKLIGTHEWHLKSHATDIVSMASGQWVVKDGNVAALYSADYEKLGDITAELWDALAPRAANIHGTCLGGDTKVILDSNKLAAVNADGRVVLLQILPKSHTFGKAIAISRDLNTLALVIQRWRGVDNPDIGLNRFSSDDRVSVYSICNHGPLFSVRVRGRSPWHSGDTFWHTIALSPQGQLLAVASNEDIQVYQVPNRAGPK